MLQFEVIRYYANWSCKKIWDRRLKFMKFWNFNHCFMELGHTQGPSLLYSTPWSVMTHFKRLLCHFHCATLYFSSEVWDILIIRLNTYGSSHGKHRKQIETNHFFSNINRSSYLGNLFCQLLLLFSEITFANDQNEKEIIQEGLLCKQKEKIWLHSFLMQYFSA